MAESNDNWECIGKVNFFWYGYQTEDLYVKYVNGIPFYKVRESVVYKSSGKHNAYIIIDDDKKIGYDKIEIDVPSGDRVD